MNKPTNRTPKTAEEKAADKLAKQAAADAKAAAKAANAPKKLMIIDVAQLAHQAIIAHALATDGTVVIPWAELPDDEQTAAIEATQHVIDNPGTTPTDGLSEADQALEKVAIDVIEAHRDRIAVDENDDDDVPNDENEDESAKKSDVPCPACTAGVHERYGICPQCNGTGIQDIDEDEIVVSAPARQGSIWHKQYVELNLHELRAVAAHLGLRSHGLTDVGQLRRALDVFPEEQIRAAIYSAEPQESEGQWMVAQTVEGIVDAIDPEGYFTATVNADGSAQVVLLGDPNLHNRTSLLPIASDVTISVPNLAGFIKRLQELNKLANIELKSKD